jgi:putative membrane protein
MKYYNTKNWLGILFRIGKSETIKKLFLPMVVMAIYASLVAYIELKVFNLNQNSFLKDLSLIYSLLGFVLSLLLVFRTNTAYDRWWEGRKLWGKLVNDSRNLAVKLNAILDNEDSYNRNFFRKSISYFPHLLSRHLSEKSTQLALDENYNELFSAEKEQHPPISLINTMMNRVVHLHKEGKISAEHLIFMDNQLSGFLEVCGGCERIKNTPIPFSYSSFVKKFILTYVIILPLSQVITVGFAMIPLTVFVFYVLMSLELIAEEIEDPFSDDENDLPTEQLAQNIEKNIQQIIYLKPKND